MSTFCKDCKNCIKINHIYQFYDKYIPTPLRMNKRLLLCNKSEEYNIFNTDNKLFCSIDEYKLKSLEYLRLIKTEKSPSCLFFQEKVL